MRAEAEEASGEHFRRSEKTLLGLISGKQAELIQGISGKQAELLDGISGKQKELLDGISAKETELTSAVAERQNGLLEGISGKQNELLGAVSGKQKELLEGISAKETELTSAVAERRQNGLYAYEFDSKGNVVVGNRTEWSYGRFGRFQGMSKNLSYSFNNQTWGKIKKFFAKLRGKKVDDEEDEKNKIPDTDDEDNESSSSSDKKPKNGSDQLDEDGYMKFSIPWSFSISYGITMAEDRSAKINVKNMRYPYKFTQNLNFSGTIKLSSAWNASFSSGYDFTNHAISMTTCNISRDMHCFNISCGFVFGTFTSYHITLRANASTLTDALKYDKKSSYSSSIRWY